MTRMRCPRAAASTPARRFITMPASATSSTPTSRPAPCSASLRTSGIPSGCTAASRRCRAVRLRMKGASMPLSGLARHQPVCLCALWQPRGLGRRGRDDRRWSPRRLGDAGGAARRQPVWLPAVALADGDTSLQSADDPRLLPKPQKFTQKNGRSTPYSLILPPGYFGPAERRGPLPRHLLGHGYGMAPKISAADRQPDPQLHVKPRSQPPLGQGRARLPRRCLPPRWRCARALLDPMGDRCEEGALHRPHLRLVSGRADAHRARHPAAQPVPPQGPADVPTAQ